MKALALAFVIMGCSSGHPAPDHDAGMLADASTLYVNDANVPQVDAAERIGADPPWPCPCPPADNAPPHHAR